MDEKIFEREFDGEANYDGVLAEWVMDKCNDWRDHFESNCPKLGKGDNHQVFTLCAVQEIPLRNKYAELSEDSEDETQSTSEADYTETSSGRACTSELVEERRARESVLMETRTSLRNEPKREQEEETLNVK